MKSLKTATEVFQVTSHPLEEPLPDIVNLVSCNLCDFTTDTAQSLETHTSATHSDVAKNTSSICEKVYETEDASGTHTEVNSPMVLNCDKCCYTTSESMELIQHTQLTHCSIQVDICRVNVIKCEFCDYSCKLNIQLKVQQKDIIHEREVTRMMTLALICIKSLSF